MESNTEKIIDLDYLSALAKGNKAFIKEMISIFLSDNPRELTAIETAISTKNFEEIKQTAHKLKSTLPVIGLDRLIGKEILEIESLALQKTDLQGIETRFKKVKDTCEKAYPELKEAET